MTWSAPRALIRIVDRSFGSFFRGQVVVVIAVGLATYAGLVLLERYAGPVTPYKLPLAVLAGALKSQEMRQLLSIRKAEAEQNQALEVQLVEQQAAAESLRLQRLQERLRDFPEAARWEWEGAKLGVARALAGNSRAFVQVGHGADIARAFVAAELLADSDVETDEPIASKDAAE